MPFHHTNSTVLIPTIDVDETKNIKLLGKVDDNF